MGGFRCTQNDDPQLLTPAAVEEDRCVWKRWRTHLLVGTVVIVVIVTSSLMAVACGSSAFDRHLVTSLEMKVHELERRCEQLEKGSKSYIDEQLASIVEQVITWRSLYLITRTLCRLKARLQFL